MICLRIRSLNINPILWLVIWVFSLLNTVHLIAQKTTYTSKPVDIQDAKPKVLRYEMSTLFLGGTYPAAKSLATFDCCIYEGAYLKSFTIPLVKNHPEDTIHLQLWKSSYSPDKMLWPRQDSVLIRAVLDSKPQLWPTTCILDTHVLAKVNTDSVFIDLSRKAILQDTCSLFAKVWPGAHKDNWDQVCMKGNPLNSTMVLEEQGKYISVNFNLSYPEYPYFQHDRHSWPQYHVRAILPEGKKRPLRK